MHWKPRSNFQLYEHYFWILVPYSDHFKVRSTIKRRGKNCSKTLFKQMENRATNFPLDAITVKRKKENCLRRSKSSSNRSICWRVILAGCLFNATAHKERGLFLTDFRSMTSELAKADRTLTASRFVVKETHTAKWRRARLICESPANNMHLNSSVVKRALQLF